MAKRARSSKTLWFNAIAGGLCALEASFHVLQPYVPGNVYAYGVVILTVGNSVLRFFTSQSIAKVPS